MSPSGPTRRWRALMAAAALALVSLGACRGGCRRPRLTVRGDAGAVVVVAPAAGGEQGGVPATPEQEPNNTVGAAQLLILAGDPLAVAVSGLLAGSGKNADTDVFKVTIPGPPPAPPTEVPLDAAAPVTALLPTARRLAVELQPEGGLAPVLQLLDPAGKALLTSSAAAGERDGLPNIAVLPGSTYLIRVRPLDRPARAAGDAAATGVGYRLLLRVLDFEVGDEREPNDTAAQATPLEGAQTSPEVAGYLGWRRDEDWYRLPLDAVPPGGVLDIELEGLEEVSPLLAVHDASGARLVAARGRRGERLALRNVAVPATAVAGPGDAGAAGRMLYLVVRAEAGRNLDRRYGLRVRPDLAKEGMELEPNDVPARASALAEGVTTGFLPTGDVDLFRYTPAAPTTVELEVTPPPRVNVKVEVLRASDGQPLASADAAGRGQSERLPALAVNEAVLVRLTQRAGDGNVDEPYQVRITSRPSPGVAP